MGSSYYPKKTRIVLVCIWLFALAVFIASAVYLYMYETRSGWHGVWHGAIAAFWTLGPPVFMSFEYYFLWPDATDQEKNFEKFAYSQGLAAAFWVGIASLLVLIAFDLTG